MHVYERERLCVSPAIGEATWLTVRMRMCVCFPQYMATGKFVKLDVGDLFEDSGDDVLSGVPFTCKVRSSSFPRRSVLL